MLWVFVFVVSCITTFLMVMVLPEDSADLSSIPEVNKSFDDALQKLSNTLAEKEHVLKESRCRIQSAEKILYDIDTKNVSIRDRYQTLMVELKNDLAKTESEYKELLDQAISISQRRENLKNDVLEQQKMLTNFNKQLEDREGSNIRTIKYSTNA